MKWVNAGFFLLRDKKWWALEFYLILCGLSWIIFRCITNVSAIILRHQHTGQSRPACKSTRHNRAFKLHKGSCSFMPLRILCARWDWNIFWKPLEFGQCTLTTKRVKSLHNNLLIRNVRRLRRPWNWTTGWPAWPSKNSQCLCPSISFLPSSLTLPFPTLRTGRCALNQLSQTTDRSGEWHVHTFA